MNRYGFGSGGVLDVRADDIPSESGPGQTFYAGVHGDLVYGGVFIPNCDLEPGSPVKLRLYAPGSRTPFRAEGTVRWKRDRDLATDACPAGVGVAWQALGGAAKKVVVRYLEKGGRR